MDLPSIAIFPLKVSDGLLGRHPSGRNQTMKFKACARSVALLLLLSASGAARSAEPGFYVGASIGKTQQDVEKGDGMVVSIGSPSPLAGVIFQVYPDSIRVESDKWGWSAALGYRLNRYFSAELSYMDLGRADVSEKYSVPAPFGISLVDLTRTFSSNVEGPAVSVLGSLPLAGGFDLFLRAGVLFADQEIEQRFSGGSNHMTFGSKVLIGGAGGQWTFASRWTARLEYLRTGALDANITSGEADLEQFALSVLFSL
jgi:hypothetical protein